MNRHPTKTNPQPPEGTVLSFIRLIREGIQRLSEAGALAAQAIDVDPDWPDKVVEACPDFTHEFIRRIELVGRKKLHASLVISETPGARRLRRLPYTLQEKHVTHPVPVVICHGDKWEILQVDIRNLTPDQAAQVFAEDRVRSEAEQRAFIEDKLMRSTAPTVTAEPYRVRGGNLVIVQPCTLNRKELTKILASME
jgi:hypothetical protein